MIPNKIYIPLYPNLDTDGFHLGDDWMEKSDSYSKYEHVEYIRKDALLEWAENWKKLGQNDDFMYAIETLVRHLNSM